ncbi:MAG: hypothetical protein OJF52_004201 [Nitrospira sp.]|nr:MAG: hypothetical protein OJF52_004201 [Nitrospira sp.]
MGHHHIDTPKSDVDESSLLAQRAPQKASLDARSETLIHTRLSLSLLDSTGV